MEIIMIIHSFQYSSILIKFVIQNGHGRNVLNTVAVGRLTDVSNYWLMNQNFYRFS